MDNVPLDARDENVLSKNVTFVESRHKNSILYIREVIVASENKSDRENDSNFIISFLSS